MLERQIAVLVTLGLLLVIGPYYNQHEYEKRERSLCQQRHSDFITKYVDGECLVKVGNDLDMYINENKLR